MNVKIISRTEEESFEFRINNFINNLIKNNEKVIYKITYKVNCLQSEEILYTAFIEYQ